MRKVLEQDLLEWTVLLDQSFDGSAGHKLHENVDVIGFHVCRPEFHNVYVLEFS